MSNPQLMALGAVPGAPRGFASHDRSPWTGFDSASSGSVSVTGSGGGRGAENSPPQRVGRKVMVKKNSSSAGQQYSCTATRLHGRATRVQESPCGKLSTKARVRAVQADRRGRFLSVNRLPVSERPRGTSILLTLWLRD
jgi:hypothetical protein